MFKETKHLIGVSGKFNNGEVDVDCILVAANTDLGITVVSIEDTNYELICINKKNFMNFIYNSEKTETQKEDLWIQIYNHLVEGIEEALETPDANWFHYGTSTWDRDGNVTYYSSEEIKNGADFSSTMPVCAFK